MDGIKFRSFKINNSRVFKNVEIPLADQGIVSVLGKNGVGKSTIFNLLQVPFFAGTPSGHKKDDLVKNDLDSSMEVNFDNGKIVNELIFKRQKKKWGYNIIQNGEDLTPHTFNDSVKKTATLLGITKSEFEGSVHLTQGSQHILIAGKPAQRKEYISKFFGIDTSYDQVQLAAKEELQKVKDKIVKVSALSHTKTVLEQEMGLITYTDPQEVLDYLESEKGKIAKAEREKASLNGLIEQMKIYQKLLPDTLISVDPDNEIKEVRAELNKLENEIATASLIKEENKKAEQINNTLDELTQTVNQALATYPDIDTTGIEEIKTERDRLQQLYYANQPLEPLRKELKTLPDVKQLPATEIENELRKVEVDLLTHQRRLTAMGKGECPECGSHFDSSSIEEEKSVVDDLKEMYGVLKEDFVVVRDRNQKAQRRNYILQTIGDIKPFTSKEYEKLSAYTGMLETKREYEEAKKTLTILDRQEIKDEVDITRTQIEIRKQQLKLEKLEVCLEAQSNIPSKPFNTEEYVQQKLEEQKVITDHGLVSLSLRQQELGKIKENNERLQRLQTQLKDVVVKLTKLEDLKKDEFYWGKLVEAYGPKGLRVQQLQKMMDVVIRRLPVYTSILFNEKGLEFEHRCDANNIEILACREEVDDEGNVKKFKHDISSFSGGEKGKMSTAFILTLADCVPPTKRSNIVILDEVDSALDEDGQFRFTNDLLPMLKENYESVFVVSHSQEIQQAAVYDQVWTVTKKNHWSVIDRVKCD